MMVGIAGAPGWDGDWFKSCQICKQPESLKWVTANQLRQLQFFKIDRALPLRLLQRLLVALTVIHQTSPFRCAGSLP